MPRRLLKDVLTLPPIPLQDVEHFRPPVAPSRAHPTTSPPPARHTLHWVLAGLAISMSGAFAAGLWVGRWVEHRPEVAPRMGQPGALAAGEGAPPAAPSVLAPAPVLLSPALVLRAPHGTPAEAHVALRAGAEADAQTWEVAGAEGLDALQSQPRPSPLLSPEDAPAGVVPLADAPFESPLPPEPRRSILEKAPSVWLPPAPSVQELPERLSREEVLAVLLAKKDELVECVHEQQLHDPELHGALVVRWNIQPAGATTGIVVESPDFRDTELARCAKRRIGAWTFPAHRLQMGPVRVPFTF